MLLPLFICLLLFTSVPVFSEEVDSTELIFNDAVVHQYSLTYYVENWVELMEYNKEDNNEEYMPARFCYHAPSGDSIVLDSIGVRYKGNSSYELAGENLKKSFKFKFDEYKDQTFFGCEKINLNNCIADPSYMREKIGYDIIRNYIPAPRVAYATLNVHDTLIGVYAQIEQVDKQFLKRHFEKSGGSLFKAGDNGAALDYKGPNKEAYEAIYEIKENENNPDAWTHLITMLYKLNDTLSGGNETIVAKTRSHLNFTNAIQHLAWTMVLSHFDSYTGTGRNYYLYDDPGSKKLVFIPWDVNMAFGQLPYQWNVITNSPFNIANIEIRPLHKRILADSELKNEYITWLLDMINGPASAEKVAQEAGRLKTIIDPYIQLEPDVNRFYPYEDFLKNINEDLVVKDGFSETRIPGIKSFSVARNAQLLEQIGAGVTPGSQTKNFKSGASFLHSVVNVQTSMVNVTYNITDYHSVSAVLYDSRGCIVKRIHFEHKRAPNIFTFSVTSLSPGTYVLSLKNDINILSERIIVTR